MNQNLIKGRLNNIKSHPSLNTTVYPCLGIVNRSSSICMLWPLVEGVCLGDPSCLLGLSFKKKMNKAKLGDQRRRKNNCDNGEGCESHSINLVNDGGPKWRPPWLLDDHGPKIILNGPRKKIFATFILFHKPRQLDYIGSIFVISFYVIFLFYTLFLNFISCFDSFFLIFFKFIITLNFKKFDLIMLTIYNWTNIRTCFCKSFRNSTHNGAHKNIPFQRTYCHLITLLRQGI